MESKFQEVVRLKESTMKTELAKYLSQQEIPRHYRRLVIVARVFSKGRGETTTVMIRISASRFLGHHYYYLRVRINLALTNVDTVLKHH